MNANRILERDYASARLCEEARLFVHLLDEGVLVNTKLSERGPPPFRGGTALRLLGVAP